jgi:hypothetical protein
LIAKILGWLEENNSLGWNVDTRSRRRVSANPGIPFARAKAPKSSNLYLVICLQAGNHGFEHSVHDDFTVAPGEITEQKEFLDKIKSGHHCSDAISMGYGKANQFTE